jgi:hypothetical protein
MATHCTGIGPIRSTVTLEGRGEGGSALEATGELVAFTWTDEEPTEPTGYWYVSPDFVGAGLVWIRADGVKSGPRPG